MTDRASYGAGGRGGVDADVYFEDDDDDWANGACSWCGGDGYSDCDDPLGCGDPGHIDDQCCPCTGCRGTGSAKHQWIF